MNTKRFLSIILVLVLYLSIPTYALDYQLSSGNNFILSDAERVKETKPNTTVSFSKGDLIQGGVKAQAIMVIELPDINMGTLMLSKKPVNLYQEIPINKLSKLKFIPTEKTNSASFCYVLKQDGALGETVIRMTVKVPKTPKTTKMKVETQKNIGVNCYVGCETGSLFDFTKIPRLGTISVAANGKSVSYIPYQNKTGTDSFTFDEIDSAGAVVATHTVEIKINKPASTIQYNDMTGSYAAYAAIKLAEAGIYTGSAVGGQLVFEPKKEVSRGDFLVMLMKSSEAELNAGAMGDKTFSDYSIMPVWLKNYVSTAVQSGVISGKADSLGNRYFDANAPLTRAEAAIMVYNSYLSGTATENLEVNSFIDSGSVPEWAVQAVYELKNCGIMRGYEDNTIRAMQPITREECASLLYAAMNYEKSSPGGIFGVFSFLNK